MSRGRYFELAFEVADPSESALEQVEDAYDCVLSTHGRSALLTLLVPGESALAAARDAIAALSPAGITIERLVDDLVTRADIAARAEVTTQAVGLWVRGERNREVPFPEPYVYAGSVTLWLWGEVVDFLRTVGLSIDAGVHYPSRQETLRIAGLIVQHRDSPSSVAASG